LTSTLDVFFFELIIVLSQIAINKPEFVCFCSNQSGITL
jgi:hypothetical protein